MLIYNKKLSVSPITTHIKIKKISGKIIKKINFDKLVTINEFFLKNLNLNLKLLYWD